MRRIFTMCALLAVAGCDSGETKPRGGAPEGGTTLVFARGNDSKSLDPAVVTEGESVKVITNLFDTLVRFKPGSLDLAPGLAESWSASADGLTWTFKLREAKFHDGSAVDADAVVFSFLRQKEALHPAHTDACAYWEDNFGMVTEVAASDPRTVRVVLAKPFAPFEATMALFSMSIVSPAAWKSEGLDAKGKFAYRFGEKPVGSGPYRFVRWNRDDTIVLEKNSAYWDGAPKVDRLVFRVVKQNQQRLLLAQSGQVHIVDGLNPADMEEVRKDPKLDLVTQPGLNIAYFAMNTTRKPFDDARVRRAVALAIDKEGIRSSAYDGVGDIAVTPLPKGMPGWKAMADRKQDVAAAKALLAEANLAGGFKFKIAVMSNPRPYMPRPKDVAIQIAQDLRAIGVTAEVEELQWARLLEDVQNARHEACLLGWAADYGDPDNFLYVLLDKETARMGSSNNAAFYTDETVHQWLTKARETTDRAERMRLYGLAQDKIFEDAPMVPLMQMPEIRAVAKRVRGYLIYPAGGEYLGGVAIE